MRISALIFLTISLLFGACAGESSTSTAEPDVPGGELEVSGDDEGDVDGGVLDDALGAPSLTPGQEVRAKYDALFDEFEAVLHDPELCVDGHWQLHYGDGQMYGPSFDLKQWRVTGEEVHRARALEALEVNRESVIAATEDLFGAMEDLETIAMSLLSLVECGLYLDDASVYREAADGLIEPLDELALGLGDYLAIDAGEFAATTYGPTALTAFLALLHFEYALAYPEHNASHHIARGEAVLDAVYSTAWDDEMATFAFAPGNTTRYLYPSITMMLAYARGYALTGDPSHLARFWQAYEGIQPLRDPAGDHYYSPTAPSPWGPSTRTTARSRARTT